MKDIIFIVLGFSVILSYGQDFMKAEYGVTYNTTLADAETKQENFELYTRLKNIEKACDSLTFILLNQSDKSLFYHPELTNPEESLEFAKTNTDGDHLYFLDKDNGVIVDLFQYWGSKIQLRKMFNDKPWEFEKESKKVGKYQCFKATKQLEIQEGGFVRHYDIIAWYTPTIPISSGPKEFGGLPGLIVELKENHLTYYLKKISFADKLFEKFEAPSSGLLMSEEEFAVESPKIKKRAKQAIINSRG